MFGCRAYVTHVVHLIFPSSYSIFNNENIYNILIYVDDRYGWDCKNIKWEAINDVLKWCIWQSEIINVISNVICSLFIDNLIERKIQAKTLLSVCYSVEFVSISCATNLYKRRILDGIDNKINFNITCLAFRKIEFSLC